MRSPKLLSAAATTASVAMLGTAFTAFTAFAALAGACSDPFDSDGYLADGGGGRDGGGTLDATLTPGVDSGPSDGGSQADSPVDRISIDGITDTTCDPKSCAAQGIACGDASDLCGRQLDCGGCHHYGDVCTAGACGCTPKTSAANCAGLCGAVPDGCAGFYDCPACGTGEHCGPDNTCSTAACVPAGDYTNACGTITDGCGGTRTAANGTDCPKNNVNNGCNAGSVANSCQCNPSSCAQQGYTCSIPGSPAVGDLCQDPRLACSACTYPPGQCNVGHSCTACTRVAAPSYAFDTACQVTGLTEAWACDCEDGGTCVVPDGVTATPVTCQFLESTSAHAIYCCKAN